MTVLGVVIVYYFLVIIQMQVFATWLLECEDSIIVDIIGNSELYIDVIRFQNVGYG